MNIQWLKNIIEKINLNISSSRINSPNYKSKTIIKSSGLKPEEAKQLITDVLNSNTIIAGLKSIAEQTYNERFIDFKNEIKSRISNLDKTELLKLADPSTQVLLIEAGKLSGLEKSKEKRGYLAKLVIERIKNQGQEDLKNVIFSDAIKITGSLTLNQLKIIALIYNLTQTKYTKIRSLDDFKDYITKYINPLLSFKGTNAEFTHLVSCGVAMYNQFGQWSLIELFKKSYSFFFLKPFNKNEVEKYLANPSIKEIIKQKSENEFEITVINSDVIKSILLEKKVKEEIINDLVKLYNSHLFNNPEAEKKIISDIPEIKKVFSKLNKSALAHISLTSIGTVIGATFMQETTGIDINIDKWIN